MMVFFSMKTVQNYLKGNESLRRKEEGLSHYMSSAKAAIDLDQQDEFEVYFIICPVVLSDKIIFSHLICTTNIFELNKSAD